MSKSVVFGAARPVAQALRPALFVHAQVAPSTSIPTSRRRPQTARGFSSSPRRNVSGHGRVIFSDASTPELAGLLSEIQDKIILPAHVPKLKRKRIFDPSQRQYLLENPVIIEVDELQHKFPPIDPLTEMPKARKTFWNALRSMRTPQDWENLEQLLAGWRVARKRLSEWDYIRIAKIAGESGNIYSIIRIAGMLRRTHYQMVGLERCGTILFWIGMRVRDSGFADKEVKQGVAWATEVERMMQMPDHYGDQRPSHRDPVVQGLAMYPAAVQAARFPNSEEALKTLELRARVLCAVWPAKRSIKNLYKQGYYENAANKSGPFYLLHSRTQKLSFSSMIQRGVQLAQKTIQNEELKAKLAELERCLQDDIEFELGNDAFPAQRGLMVHGKMFGEGSEPEPRVAKAGDVADSNKVQVDHAAETKAIDGATKPPGVEDPKA